MRNKKLLLSAFMCLLSVAIKAQKIDFDMTGRNTSEVTEAEYQSWQVPKALSATNTFKDDEGRDITIDINCGEGSPENRTLKSNWNKNIVQKESKLVGDAVVVYGFDSNENTPHLTNESATLNMTIGGLAAGEHTLLAYMNVTDGNITSIAPIDVLVNGEKVVSGLIMSNQATAASATATAYLKFDVAEGESVKISFVSQPEQGKTYSTTGVYINAIVFDRPNPSTTALDPYPANLDMHANADDGSLNLAWTQAASAVKNIIYLGTNKNEMVKIAETTTPTYRVTDLSTHNVYYWRVDQCDANGVTYQGDVWTFRPRRLAFPGAEGYGKYAIGGRGGTVYHVTSLEDYTDAETPIPGTFRYGIREVTGPRTIVFDISGIIALKARLTCSDPYVYVAGQTAPGKGVLFRGAPFGMANDGITRFLRVRRGYHNDDEEDINRGLDGLGMAGNNFSIMDHCSVGWTIDEAFSSRNAKNITLQRTLISEALNNANHPNYSSGKTHGFAATIGGDTGTYHHNLLAHNSGRNWSLSGGLDGKGAYAGRHDIFNNVVYNWDSRTTDGGTHECNFVSNYYKMGPASNNKCLLTAQLEGTGTGSQSYYVKGNIRDNKDGTLTEDKEGTTYKYERASSQVLDWDVFVDQPFFKSFAEIESAKLAYKTVLSDVGANQPIFDDHDIRMVKETFGRTYTYVGSKTGKKGLIDREADAGGYEEFPIETRSENYDSDMDGMPDWWETANGLNPYLADNNKTSSPFGYTALEEYLNWLSEPHYTIESNKKNEVVDLRTLFKGFNDDLSYELTSVSSGCVANIEAGMLFVTPSAGDSRLEKLSVKVTDGDNVGSMTRTINLYVKSGISDGIYSCVDNHQVIKTHVYSSTGILLREDNNTGALTSGVYIIKEEMSNGTTNVRKVRID